MQTVTRLAPFRPSVLVGLALLFSLPLLGCRLFQWTLISLVTQFLAPLLQLMGWLVFFAGIILTCMYIRSAWVTHRYRAIAPLLVYLLVLLATRVVPFSTISFDLDVHLKQRERERVVALLSDQFHSDASIPERLVTLPAAAGYLSSGGGEVIVSKDATRLVIMFYMWRGVLDTSSGFVVFTSDNTAPSEFNRMMRSSTRLQDHWFFGIEY